MILGQTKSLCPSCLKKIEAERVYEGNAVFLRKVCSEHGEYKTVVWRGTAESFVRWGDCAEAGQGCSTKTLTPIKEDCPFDCGLCPAHTGGACVVLMEVTNRCNIRCPICFSSSGEGTGSDPDLATIERMYGTVIESGGPFPLQLSGGEPTLRDDLPEIVALGKRMGFEMIQINTNGLRFAEDPEYLAQIKQNGACSLYLQFDGLTDDVYEALRGAPLADAKVRTIDNCASIGLGVVLVAVIVPGINDHQIGGIIQFAKARIPTVRGVHFQPISYFGRYPHAPRDEERITLPEILTALEGQTAGEVAADDFKPKKNKEGHCSFAGCFVLGDDGVLRSSFSQGAAKNPQKPDRAVRQFLQDFWSPAGSDQCGCSTSSCQDSSYGSIFDDFKGWVQARTLTISGMPFQDVWNIDLERLEGCCIHVVTSDNRLVPFCARYVTSTRGETLYHP